VILCRTSTRVGLVPTDACIRHDFRRVHGLVFPLTHAAPHSPKMKGGSYDTRSHCVRPPSILVLRPQRMNHSRLCPRSLLLCCLRALSDAESFIFLALQSQSMPCTWAARRIVRVLTPARVAASAAYTPTIPRILSTPCMMAAVLPRLCEPGLGPGTTPRSSTDPVSSHTGHHTCTMRDTFAFFLAIVDCDCCCMMKGISKKCMHHAYSPC
jgi:hypothetical protein